MAGLAFKFKGSSVEASFDSVVKKLWCHDFLIHLLGENLLMFLQ